MIAHRQSTTILENYQDVVTDQVFQTYIVHWLFLLSYIEYVTCFKDYPVPAVSTVAQHRLDSLVNRFSEII